jgi:hypothetical protein
MRMILLLTLATVACGGPSPPPPILTVTSPQRGLVQSDAAQLTVTGTAQPGTLGTNVTKVTVNGVAATLHADGSFVATLDASQGAMLLETTASADDGGAATDTRAVQSGALHPVGTPIAQAITIAMSADAFTHLSATAGPLLKSIDVAALLAPYQPMVSAGDSIANFKLSVTDLTYGNTQISLSPVTGGLAFSAQLDALQVTANVAYGGALVPDGSSIVHVTADRVTIGGTLAIAPAGTAGFTTQLTSPTVNTVGLKLQASGLAGNILGLLDGSLDSSIQSIVTKSAEVELAPLINGALGALAGPQQLDVLGVKLDLQASPSAITFTPSGALVTMNLQAMLEGAEASPGYIATTNTPPGLTADHGVQLGLADDLVNELLAQAHTLGLLDLNLQQDLGIADAAQFQLTMPPMISANNADGSLRLVLGDMIATFGKAGKTIAKAAINAQIDLKVAPADAQNIALQLGKADLRIDLLDGGGGSGGSGGDPVTTDDLSGAATLGLNLQLDSLSKLLIKLPIPSFEGIQLENVSIGADGGYVVMSGQIQ